MKNSEIVFAFNPNADLVWFADIDAIKIAEKNPQKETNWPLSISQRDSIEIALGGASMFGEEVEDSADGMSLELRIFKQDSDERIPFEKVKSVLIKAGFVQNEFYNTYCAG